MKKLYTLLVLVLMVTVGCAVLNPPVVRTVHHCTTEEERATLSAFILQCVSGSLGEADKNMVYSCEDVGKRTVCPKHQHEYAEADSWLTDDYSRELPLPPQS